MRPNEINRSDIVCACRILIVDKCGKSMQPKEERDLITLWSERVEPAVGDKLTLGYDICQKGNKSEMYRRITLKVIERELWFAPPRFSFAGDIVFDNMGNNRLGISLGGLWLDLTCTPDSKGGSAAGVKRLVEYYRRQRKLVQDANHKEFEKSFKKK